MFELIVAFGAGLISFLSPCVLPLIPGYISYITGNSLSELIEKKKVNLIPIILFTVGASNMTKTVQDKLYFLVSDVLLSAF